MRIYLCFQNLGVYTLYWSKLIVNLVFKEKLNIYVGFFKAVNTYDGMYVWYVLYGFEFN